MALSVLMRYVIFLRSKKNAEIYFHPFKELMGSGSWSSNFLVGYVKYRGRYRDRMVRLTYSLGKQRMVFTLASDVSSNRPLEKKPWFTLGPRYHSLGAGLNLSGNTIFYSREVKHWGAPESGDLPDAEWLLNLLLQKCDELEKSDLDQESA